MTVTVSMPYYGTGGTVLRAVESVLAQTHSDLRLVVVNDGRGPEAWEPLEGVDDPRLVRLDLPVNRGRYYCDAVVLAACDTEYWMVHDSDDFTESEHIASLLAGFDPGIEAVLGGYRRHYRTERVLERPVDVEAARAVKHATHYGATLWRAEAARDIGGPNPQWRIAYDTVLVALTVRYLSYACIESATYHHILRRNSLSQSRSTGMQSPARRAVHKKRARLWSDLKGVTREGVPAVTAAAPFTLHEVRADADRLRELL